MTGARVFVSYSHLDSAFAQRLVNDLRNAGAQVWYDVSGIDSGDFMARIGEALRQCEWLVVVLTPSALASPYVQMEVNAALHRVQQGYMRVVLPMLAVPCPPDSIPALWDVLHRYDAVSDYGVALAGLCFALGLTTTMPGTTSMSSAVPVATPATFISNDHFPPRLAQLGFVGRVINGVEVIVPPLCDVPAGEFLMGTDPSRDKSDREFEKPQRQVMLSACKIACYPVTVAEYACAVRAGGVRETQKGFLPGSRLPWQRQLDRLDHPIVCVTWHDATTYARWLAQVTGQLWRLPTEEEWEKAARGTDGGIYPWGDSFERTRCNTSESGLKTTTPVGRYPNGASPYGAHDMTGNVWEWTSSTPGLVAMFTYHEKYWPITRGVSWSDSGYLYGRAACRRPQTPDYWSTDIGLRLAFGAASS